MEFYCPHTQYAVHTNLKEWKVLTQNVVNIGMLNFLIEFEDGHADFTRTFSDLKPIIRGTDK